MDIIQRTALAKMAGVDPPKIDLNTGEEEAKVRIRVTMPNTLQHNLCGQLVEKGETILIVYTSQVEHIKKHDLETATEDEMRLVHAEYERQRRQWHAKNTGKTDAECPVSIEAAFRHVMERDMRCISAVEVLDGKRATKAA